MRPIQHRLCATCGIRVHGEGSDSKGSAVAAINQRCVDDVDLAQVPVMQHDGESMRDRHDVG